MIVIYIIVGGILGFVVFGPPGALFGIGLGIAFGVSQAAEKKTRDLENKVQLLEAKLNNEIMVRKTVVKEEI